MKKHRKGRLDLALRRSDVLDAISEFDQLGRDAFLEKYGFGRARKFLIRHNGKLYDSKAIVGVAYGFRFPNHGALQSADFSGGRATVVPLLRELGFEVIELV